MRVIRIRPGELPEVIDIPNELSALQEQGEGYIECVAMDEDTVIICNEEGAINGSKFNLIADGHYLFGTILIAGVNGEEFCDIPEDAEVAYLAAWGITKASCDQYRRECGR